MVFNKHVHYRIRLFIDYILTSLATAAVDFSLFYVFLNELSSRNVGSVIFTSTILARVFSGIIGYTLNKRVVFKADNSETFVQLIKHLSITTVQMLLSASLLTYVHYILQSSAMIEKMFVDTTLFVVFYFVQKFWVFKYDRNKK